MKTQAKRGQQRLDLLDYGRFFAALGVVAFHYFYNGIANGKITSISTTQEVTNLVKYGYFGVHFFFIISGYVIFFSARNRTPTQFASSRFIRLYPTFWFAVLFTTICTVFIGHPTLKVTATQFLANLTMFAPALGQPFVDGVYWTLIYEAIFYLFIFGILIVGLQKKLENIVLFWPYLMVIAYFAGLGNLPIVGSYFYFFAAGALFAIQKERMKLSNVIPLLLVLPLCISKAIEDASDFNGRRGELYSETVVALLATSFFAFFLILNTKKASSIRLYKSQQIGALTYPTYLIHAHLGYILLSRFANETNKAYIYIITLGLTLAISLLINKYIEIALKNLWKKLFDETLGKAITKVDKWVPKLVFADKKESLENLR